MSETIQALSPLERELYEALELADILLAGANMDRAFVERKVRAAIDKVRGPIVGEGEGRPVPITRSGP